MNQKGEHELAKYKNIQELADAFKSGELKDWILMVDEDITYLSWIGKCPYEPGTAEEYDFLDHDKYNEGCALWFSSDVPDNYLLGQALTAAGIPNDVL